MYNRSFRKTTALALAAVLALGTFMLSKGI